MSKAILEAVKHCDGNERTRKQYVIRANAFIDYLKAHASGVRSWADVTEEIIGNFVKHCRREGISHDSLRLRLYSLRLTSRFMAQTYPALYRNVTANLKIKRNDPPKAELEAKDAILTPDQLRGLLAWLKEHAPMVHVWAILQGLCGLRLYEATFCANRTSTPPKGRFRLPRARRTNRRTGQAIE